MFVKKIFLEIFFSLKGPEILVLFEFSYSDG